MTLVFISTGTSPHLGASTQQQEENLEQNTPYINSHLYTLSISLSLLS